MKRKSRAPRDDELFPPRASGLERCCRILSLAPKAFDRPKREKEINIGYSCVITHRSIVLIGQSNFNGAGCSKDCGNDLARQRFHHAHHGDEVHFERKFAHDGRPRLTTARFRNRLP